MRRARSSTIALMLAVGALALLPAASEASAVSPCAAASYEPALQPPFGGERPPPLEPAQ